MEISPPFFSELSTTCVVLSTSLFNILHNHLSSLDHFNCFALEYLNIFHLHFFFLDVVCSSTCMWRIGKHTFAPNFFLIQWRGLNKLYGLRHGILLCEINVRLCLDLNLNVKTNIGGNNIV